VHAYLHRKEGDKGYTGFASKRGPKAKGTVQFLTVSNMKQFSRLDAF
jgi:hypothetical protein